MSYEGVVSTNLREDGTLEIFVGNAILATIENGKEDEDFIEDVLYGMGYIWNEDGLLLPSKKIIKEI